MLYIHCSKSPWRLYYEPGSNQQWPSPTLLFKHTVSKSGWRLIQQIGRSSSKSMPYNSNAKLKTNGWFFISENTRTNSKQWMNCFMKFIILLIKNISPDIFVMASSISWQHTLSPADFPSFHNAGNYTKRYFPSLQACSCRQLYSLHRNPKNPAWVRKNRVQTRPYL